MTKDSDRLQHHFGDANQQYESSQLGMWTFLLTEVLFFGGIFTGYIVYRVMYPQAFALSSHHLDVFLGALNTVVLIGSSLTMAMAVHSAQLGHRKQLSYYLGGTIVLGVAFLGVKAVEYHAKFVHHLVPGKHFHFPDFDGPGTELFYSFYFGMTGLHALHMVVGIVILLILLINSLKGKYTKAYFTPVEMTGLYWHFVDIVWIFLFPLLYLVGRH